MNDELKLKYKNLFYNLNNINNKLKSISYKVDSLRNYLNDNFVIDNQVVENNRNYYIKNEINTVSNELSNVVIPSVRNKSF